MDTYIITLDGDVLRIGFGVPANNDVIVRDVANRLDEMCDGGELQAGRLVKVDGPASLPVAMVLADKLSDLFDVIACFDPRMNRHVVVISRDPMLAIGTLI